MRRKLLYLINPISGTGNKKKLFEEISRQTLKSGFQFQVIPTNADGMYSHLPRKIAHENITDVIVCGGDGSISRVAAALDKVDVSIGVVPMGSGNGLALAAGISKNVSKALSVIFEGKAEHIDGFYINKTFACMLSGLGFDAQVAHDFSREKTRGLMTYTKQTIKNFMDAKPYPFVLHLNGETIKTEAFFISVANSNQFGNHVTIAPKASLTDGLLDIVIAEKMNKAKLLMDVGMQLVSGQVDEKMKTAHSHAHVKYFQTTELTIENKENAPLHIDGDPMDTSDKFEIRVYPKAFRLLQPQK